MYAWILKNLEQLGSTGERIVLLGDSAGGNLVVAVALKVRTYVRMYMWCIPCIV